MSERPASDRSVHARTCSFTGILLIILVIGTIFVPPAWPSCGLEGCPLDSHARSWLARSVFIETSFHQTEYDIEGESGNYSEVIQRLEYVGMSPMSVGAYVPLVTLRRDEEEQQTGFGNPILYVEARLFPRAHGSMAAGMQYEAPIGDAESGIASDHTELLPYAAYLYRFGRGGVRALVGYRFSVGSGEDEAGEVHEHAHGSKLAFHNSIGQFGAPAHVVNPHADQELVWRTGFDTQFGARGLRPGLALEGQTVTEGPDRGTSYVASELSLGVPFWNRYQLNAHTKFPLTSLSRFEWMSGLGISAAF